MTVSPFSRRHVVGAILVAAAAIILWKHPSRADAWFNPWHERRTPAFTLAENTSPSVTQAPHALSRPSAFDAVTTEGVTPAGPAASAEPESLMRGGGVVRRLGPAWTRSPFRLAGSSGSASLHGGGSHGVSGGGFGGVHSPPKQQARTPVEATAPSEGRTSSGVTKPIHPTPPGAPRRTPAPPAPAPTPVPPLMPAPVPPLPYPPPMPPLFPPPAGPPIGTPSVPTIPPSGGTPPGPLSPTPEPSSMLLIGSGVAAVAGMFRTRRTK